MSALKRELDKILEIIPPGSRVIYVDYPVYHNVGDLLIMLGTERFFQENDITTIAKYNIHNYPWDLNIPKDVKIVCQGGGNFGDIWELHQNFRNKLLHFFPTTPIIILSQSIYFGNEKNARLVRRLFEKHQDNFVFVRERDSEKQIEKWLPDTRYSLCPDMSHMLWPELYRGDSLGSERLGLLRCDKEKSTSLMNSQKSIDWNNIITREDSEFAAKIIAANGEQEDVHQKWLEHVVKITNRAISTFSGAKEVVTDRLHGHLLSCLMGIPGTFYQTPIIRIKVTMKHGQVICRNM